MFSRSLEGGGKGEFCVHIVAIIYTDVGGGLLSYTATNSPYPYGSLAHELETWLNQLMKSLSLLINSARSRYPPCLRGWVSHVCSCWWRLMKIAAWFMLNLCWAVHVFAAGCLVVLAVLGWQGHDFHGSSSPTLFQGTPQMVGGLNPEPNIPGYKNMFGTTNQFCFP